MELRRDGTFIGYNGDQKIHEGRWYLTKRRFGGQGIELDRISTLGLDGRADEFELVRRYGRICWRTASIQEEYFCKSSS